MLSLLPTTENVRSMKSEELKQNKNKDSGSAGVVVIAGLDSRFALTILNNEEINDDGFDCSNMSHLVI